MPQIKLLCSDGVQVDVDAEVMQCSNVIKDFEGEDVIPVPNVNSTILKKVVAWATHHKEEDDKTKEEQSYDDISAWDKEFMNVEQRTVFELILAANYLDIKGLLDVPCKTVGNLIKGKTPDEVREQFNIKTPLTEAEKEQMRKENQWCEEK